MIRLRKILYPTDFSRCADQALDHALYLAKKYQAELHWLHAVVLHEDDPLHATHHFPQIDDIQKRLKDLANEKMVNAMEPHKDIGIAVKMEQVRGVSSGDVILDYAREHDIDLIVMGTHGRRGIGHLFLGSVAEHVMRMAPCPVLTQRERKTPLPVHEAQNILVPVDFSEHAKNAVSYAKEIASAYQAEIQLLHVIEETVHPAFYGTGKSSIIELRPNIIPKSEEAMQRVFDESPGPKVKAEYHAVLGHAAGTIVEFSKTHSTDLIVIATQGATGIEHLLIGSVTEKVVRMALCPVFTIKAFGKSLIQ